jgi:hypothetical protein
MNMLSMGNVIQKLIPMNKTQTLGEYNKVNATKVNYKIGFFRTSLNISNVFFVV